jgi:flavin reductase (DIM6/NTAB) family NADH-FMN oxidoreductase RutF
MKKSLGANTFACPSPVWCIGTYDKHGRPNVMAASWAGICCGRPPAVTVSLRKATYTYHSILHSRAYTVSIPSERWAKEADYFGIASGKDTDKFRETGLTPVRSELVDAPYVAEFPLVLECALLHHHEIGLHTYFIGEILDVKADEDMLTAKGKVDMAKVQPFLYSAPQGTYFGMGPKLGEAYILGKDLKSRE